MIWRVTYVAFGDGALGLRVQEFEADTLYELEGLISESGIPSSYLLKIERKEIV